jgi:hypothetical protein
VEQTFTGDAADWYTRACYVRQFGALDVTNFALSRAFTLKPGLRAIALEEKDLELLLDSLATGWLAH